jgi:hypothetical protein
MRNTVVKLPFVRAWTEVALTDAFGVNSAIAVFVTRIVAVRASHAWAEREETSATSAPYDVLEPLE